MPVRVKLAKSVRDRVSEVADELQTIKLERSCGVAPVLPQIREILEIESVGVYSVRNRTGQWEIERWEAAGFMDDALPLARTMFMSAPEFPLYYNPLVPIPAQRNRVIDALAWVESHKPGTWDQSPMCERVLRPLGVHRFSQPRALLYRGPTLLGWFGGLGSRKPSARQLHLLSLLVEPMRRRLDAEQRLATDHAQPALEAALDRLGSAAFVLTRLGAIVETNHAGHALLARDRTGVTAALRDAVARRCNGLAVELIPLTDTDASPLWLAVIGVQSADERIRACIENCRIRWRLTPRQTEVLALIAQGLPNATIAAQLACVERTVELHVTALFDRAGVDSRSALVSRVLTALS
jgi:DNA-binding NarL/FixJ family response regulator